MKYRMNLNPNKPPAPLVLKPEDLIPYREPGELQTEPAVPAQEILGYENCRVFLTMEKKMSRNYLKEENEDNVLADPGTGLFGVMDGLGGMGSGDLASKAVERKMPDIYSEELEKMGGKDISAAINEIVKSQLPRTIGVGDATVVEKLSEEMKKRMAKADPEIIFKALALLRSFKRLNVVVKGTGGMTTACIGLVHKTPDGRRYAIVANLGDSGALIRHEDGSLERLTDEDSAFDDLVRQGVKINGLDLKDYLELGRDRITGKININYPVPIPITPGSCRAMTYTQDYCDEQIKKGVTAFNMDYGTLMATVTGCLGTKTPETPSLEIVELESGDELVMCTDGILDKYENQKTGETDYPELANDLDIGRTPEDRLDNLRVMARQRRTYKLEDDVAIVLVSAD